MDVSVGPADPGSERPISATRPAVTRRLAMLSGVAALIAGLSYVVTVGTHSGQLLGELILGGRPATIETLAAAEQVLGALSRASLAVGTAVIVVIGLVQRRPRLAMIALATVVGANVTTQLLKSVFLDRTDLLGGLFYPLGNSFPSGHVTAAASIGVGLILVLPPLLRAPTVLISAVVVGAVAASTMIAGWHRLADAGGGVFVATAWGAGLAAILSWRRGIDVVGRRTSEFGRRSAKIALWIGVGFAGLGGIAYVVVAVDPLGVLTYLAQRGGSPALFWAAILIAVGISLISLGALGLALRDVHLDPRRLAVGATPDGVPSDDVQPGPAGLGS